MTAHAMDRFLQENVRHRKRLLIAIGLALIAAQMLVTLAVIVVLAGRLASARKALEDANARVAALEAAATRPRATSPQPATRRAGTPPAATRPTGGASAPRSRPAADDGGARAALVALRTMLAAAGSGPLSGDSLNGVRSNLRRLQQAIDRGDLAEADAAATVDVARRALVGSLLAAGELSEAASLLESLPAADRGVRRLRGELQARRGDHVAAVQLLEPLVSADPMDIEARVWLGRSLFHVGRLDDADRQFEWLASNRPDRPEGFYWRGIVQLRRLNADKAVPLFDQTVAVDPAFGPAWEASAVALASLGKVGEALQRLEEAARLSPQRAEIPFAQAVCFARVNQREAAVAALRRAVAMDATIAQRARSAPAFDRLLRDEDWRAVAPGP